MKLIRWLRHVHIAIAVLGSFSCLGRAPGAEIGSDKRPVLQVPSTESGPVVDGKLDEACWKDAAKTGPLAVTGPIRACLWPST